MSANQEIIEKTERYALHVYNRFPIAIDHGQGVQVWDADGKVYLDFMAGIAVYAGNSGSADEAAIAFAAGQLKQNADANCDHHDHEHGEGCGHHGEGEHHCCH